MSRGKSITKQLLDASVAALFAGIEIHNKPHISYRYSSSIILIINAWELALKAFVYKYVGKKEIYEGKDGHTISFTKAADIVRNRLNAQMPKSFEAVFSNLMLLNEYRCSDIHFVGKGLDAVAFMILSKAVLNYDEFIKVHFRKDITRDDNLIIMPIGLKLPLNPIEYLKQEYKSAASDFVSHVLKDIRTLNNQNIQESILVGFDVFTTSVKKTTNADIIAAIDSNASLKLVKTVRVTDDPNAPIMRIEPDVLPLTYKDLQKKLKERNSGIKFGVKFNEIIRALKKEKTLCQVRLLNPKKKDGAKTYFYAEAAVDFVLSKY